MIKLGVALDSQVPPSVRFYRTMGPISFLEKQFPHFRVEYKPANYFLSHELHAFPYDIVLIERPITTTASQVIQTCKMQGVVTWIDIDDNLFQIPDYNQAQDYFGDQRNFQTVQQCLSMADLITVSTPHLKNLYGGINPNTHVIRNAWNNFRFPMPEYDDVGKPIKITWRGGNKHGGDVFPVRMALQHIINDSAFDFTFYGQRSEFAPYLTIPRDNYRPFSGLFAYFRDFILSKPDFLFVPLQVNDFNISKSNCSWLEASLAGAVTIAPMQLPEFDQPGVIRYKDNAHLKQIFQGIKKGKYDKRERVEASRQALREGFRLSDANYLRKGLLEAFFPVPNEKANASTEG